MIEWEGATPFRGDFYKQYLMELFNLVRSDARSRLAGQVAPEGSGPWAIMQHWAGKTLKFGTSIWKPDEEPTQIGRSALLAESGWSVVSDEPKPMTFKDGDVVRIDSTDRKCVMRGGQWFEL